MENPYQNRKTIKNPDEFFGRKKEIKRIFSLISDAAEPHSISIMGERESEKSSLFHFLKDEATRKKFLKDFNNYIFVCLELNAFLDYDTEKFCEMLLRELSSAASEEIPSSGINIYDKFEKFIDILSSDGKKIIIMFNKFDNVLKIPAFNSDLPDYFRSLSCGYPLSFITFSRVSIRELENRLRGETEEDISPFFNVFYNINLD
jgi:Cdc6-like AAA superfamily ATPase